MNNILQFLKYGGIHIKKKNKGLFTDYCNGKVTQECINRGKHSSNPITRKRATFADNARHWVKKGQNGLTIPQVKINGKWQNLTSDGQGNLSAGNKQFKVKTKPQKAYGNDIELIVTPQRNKIVADKDRNKVETPYSSAYHPEDVLEGFNVLTFGGMNNLSPTQWARRAYDLKNVLNGDMSFGKYAQNWVNGNNGIVSDNFAKEHPYWSMTTNGVADLATLGIGSNLGKLKDSFSIGSNTTSNITDNFLKFTGGNGKPLQPAVPRTQAQIELYARLKDAGVDMSKISIKDINKALQLREQQLIQSGKSFSYQQPVTNNSEIIYSIDNGVKTGYIDLRKPFQDGSMFSPEAWEAYINNPRKQGLGIGMVENSTQTHPELYNTPIKGIQERLTNSAIDVSKQQGYKGVVSGETLLSPEKTTRLYPKYKYKRLLDQNGRYHWENHNPEMSEQSGPVYMLEKPTYKTITKSQIFDPRIIDKNGKMKINWGKGATLFNSVALPLTLYYGTN